MRTDVIDSSFRSLCGRPCWGVRYDRQLNLSLNFGKPSLDVREPYDSASPSDLIRQRASQRDITVRGQWWLWIYCCFWRLTSGDLDLATGSSSLRRIERATQQLDGQKLVSVAVLPSTGATRFEFDLGCVLHCRRFEQNSADELWTLYKPRGYVLSICGNGTFSHQRDTEVKNCFRPIEDGVRSES